MNLAAAAGPGPRSEATESHWPPGWRGAAAPQRQPGQLSALEKMGLPEDMTESWGAHEPRLSVGGPGERHPPQGRSWL